MTTKWKKHKKKINVEQDELEVNPQTLEVVKDHDDKPLHPPQGQDPAGDTHATVGNVIIPKEMSDAYLKGDENTKRQILAQVVQNAQQQPPQQTMADGGPVLPELPPSMSQATPTTDNNPVTPDVVEKMKQFLTSQGMKPDEQPERAGLNNQQQSTQTTNQVQSPITAKIKDYSGDFRSAFGLARKERINNNGPKTFRWDGKEYGTELASEVENKPSSQGKLSNDTKLTPTVQIGNKSYYGKDHGVAMHKAIDEGEELPEPETDEGKQWRKTNGKFTDHKGNVLTREESMNKYGVSETKTIPSNNLSDKPMAQSLWKKTLDTKPKVEQQEVTADYLEQVAKGKNEIEVGGKKYVKHASNWFDAETKQPVKEKAPTGSVSKKLVNKFRLTSE